MLFVVAFLTNEAFVTYLVAFMILTDMICNTEIKYLRFYAFPTPHSKQESLRFCVNVKMFWQLLVTRESAKYFYVIQFCNGVKRLLSYGILASLKGESKNK